MYAIHRFIVYVLFIFAKGRGILPEARQVRYADFMDRLLCVLGYCGIILSCNKPSGSVEDMFAMILNKEKESDRCSGWSNGTCY